jgi:hypothetical protein
LRRFRRCRRTEERALDERLKPLIRDLRRALAEAISESSDVSRSLRRIREEGYAMVLHLDCKRDGDEEPPLVPASRAAVLADPLPEKLARTVKSPKPESNALVPSPEPAFQIDGRDLSFLRSIGIDPTRRLRRKK